MTNWLVAAQAPFLAAVLVWAGALKLTTRSAPRSALRRLVGEGRVVPALRVVGCLEICIAAALFTHLGAAVAAAWCVALAGYLLYSRIAAPQSSCGCLGKGAAPVGARNFGRTGLMTLAAAVNLAFPRHLTGGGWVAVTVLEVALIVLLSPELDVHWLLPLRRRRTVHHHPLSNDSDSRHVPIEASVRLLIHSDAYRPVGGLLRSDLLDTWDEGEWRLMTYAMATDAGHATAVFAVPLTGHHPDDVRVAIVEDAERLLDVPSVG
jgi:hypothetical protein